MIIFQKGQIEGMLQHCLNGLPNESCGLLGGTIDGENKVIHKIYLLRNLDASHEHFSIDPSEQFSVIADLRKNAWELIGNFHSHPNSPSRPSDEDKRLAFDPKLSYLILSLQDCNNPVLNSFFIKGEDVFEEDYVVVE